MPIWFYELPNWLMFIVVVAVALAVSWSAVFLLRPVMARLFRDEGEEGRNGLLDMVLSGTGLFYGLLLGLIAVASYNNFTDAQNLADNEASTAGVLYRDVSAYPEPIRAQLRSNLESYVHNVIDKEWPAQQRGEPAVRSTGQASGVQGLVASFQSTPAQQALQAETLTQADRFLETRRKRLDATSGGLPASLWWVLILGALINLTLIAMLAVRRLAVHLLISSLFAVFVGMMIFLIAALDHPFVGDYSVNADAFVSLRDTLMAH